MHRGTRIFRVAHGTSSGVTLDFHSVNVKQKRNDTAHEEYRALRFPISNNTPRYKLMPPRRSRESQLGEKIDPPLLFLPPFMSIGKGESQISDLHYVSDQWQRIKHRSVQIAATDGIKLQK